MATTTRGYTGSRGVTGSLGPRGLRGYSGSKGDIGDRGYNGSQGIRGLRGFNGSRGAGYTGSRGALGYNGSRGLNGLTGSVGYTGSKGDRGLFGYSGSRGLLGSTGSQGWTGSKGVTGYTGSRGTAGTDGDRGLRGYDGSAGARGYSGSAGLRGFVGSTGIQGGPGYVGSRGPRGITGWTGSHGTQGFSGSRGTAGGIGYSGSKGASGFTGSQGARGFVGYVGSTGTAGTVGYTGSKGASGFTGSRGATGLTGSRGQAGALAVVGTMIPSNVEPRRFVEGDIYLIAETPAPWTLNFDDEAAFQYIENNVDNPLPVYQMTLVDESGSGGKKFLRLQATDATSYEHSVFRIKGNMGDGHYRMLFRVAGATPGSSTQHGPALHVRQNIDESGDDGTSYSFGHFRASGTGSGSAPNRIRLLIDGVSSVLGWDDTALPFTHNQWAWAELYVNGTTLEGRYWLEEGTRPTDPVVAATDGTLDINDGGAAISMLGRDTVFGDIASFVFIPVGGL